MEAQAPVAVVLVLFPAHAQAPDSGFGFSATRPRPCFQLGALLQVSPLEMTRVYVGNLDSRVTERELEDEFWVFGVLRSIWVARKPPGYAFIDFDDRRDALDTIRELDGKNGWRVELSHNSRGGGGCGGSHGHSGSSDLKCYECGETRHFACECRLRIGPRGLGSGRRRSRTPPRYRRSPSYCRRSYSPRDRSPRQCSVSPLHGRSYSKSPPYHCGREESPYANRRAVVRDRRRSRS
ncbi:hypothetical protein MRB53_017849 [Persea americana]|uniref:Uncharacterized protein n=1 Tax=Persea americana TaxID=3435 RepID=A0ACC2M699_PERAE|nr:hypothetical protein MRB53_017849 [Persea americana]